MHTIKWLVTVGLIAGAAGGAIAQDRDHKHMDRAVHNRIRVDASATREFKAIEARMMRKMAMPFTGDPDVDFRMHMISHHQAAIDMARVALRHANEDWTRQAAQGIILAQQQEIYQFQNWLARRGKMVPPGGQPRYIINSATAYPDIEQPEQTGGGEDERGSLNELVGRTWAPGSGVPAQPEGTAHGRHRVGASATREFKAASSRMMRNMMNVPFTGDPDVDFRTHMIAHHRGAMDMAQVALRHAKNPWTRQVADAIVTAQKREIYDFQSWLARRGVMVRPG